MLYICNSTAVTTLHHRSLIDLTMAVALNKFVVATLWLLQLAVILFVGWVTGIIGVEGFPLRHGHRELYTTCGHVPPFLRAETDIE